MNKYYNADNAPRGSRRVTSDVYALATAVLFQSPVQHFALAPNNLTDAPSWAIDFMKEVPTIGMRYVSLTVILANTLFLPVVMERNGILPE